MPPLAFEEITPKKLAEVDKSELLNTHRRLHEWWTEGALNDENLFNAHEFVVEEMERRDIEHDSPLKPEDRGKQKQSNSFPDPESLFNSWPDKLILIPEYVQLSGSYVDDHTIAEDIDLIVKSTAEETGFSQTMMKLPRATMKEVSHSLHFVPNQQGAFFNYIPAYDLALVKRAGCEFRNIDGEMRLTGAETKESKQAEPEKGKISVGKPYLTSKTASGFFDFNELWDKWAEPIIEGGSKINVEKKFDGIKGSIHRDGDTVKIFTEDTNQDIAWKLPELIPVIKAQSPRKFIIEAELVQYDDKGLPKRRQDMAALFAGKEPVRDFKAHVYDVLWLGDKNLTELLFFERRKMLEDNFKASNLLEVVPSKIAKDKEELKRAVNIVSKEIGSEGAMLKDSNGPYELDGSTNWQSKIKNIIEIDTRIIGFRKQPLPKTSVFPEKKKISRDEMLKALPDLLKGSNTFIYRVAVVGPGGKEIPIESEKTLTESDLKIDWDEDKQEWKGNDDPALWTMAQGWTERKKGEQAYGNTYAAQLTPRPKLGEILTVAPVEVTEFKPGRFSWTFPTVQGAKPSATSPGDIRQLEVIKKETSEKQKKPQREFEEELPLTSEEQQQLTEQAIGDYYMVEENGKKHRGVIQHHLRGVWSDKEREEVKKAWRSAKTQDDIDKISKDNNILFLKLSPEALTSRAAISDNSTKTIDNAIRKPKLDDDMGKLVNRGSAHSDLRIEEPSGKFLFGWTLNTPTSVIQFLDTGKHFFPIRDKFLDNEKRDNIVAEKKLPQPNRWLTIAKPEKPFTTTRPELGATEKTSGIFYAEDFFDVVFGNQKSDSHEYFLFFDKPGNKDISGRWIVRTIPGAEDFEKVEGPFWQMSRPLEQTPYIQTHDKEKELAKAKREKIEVVWNDETISALKKLGYADLKEPEQKSGKLLVKEIAKADTYHRYLLGVVMIPNYLDTDGDTITESEIKKSEKAFLNNGAKIGIDHSKLTDSLWIAKSIILGEPKSFVNVKREIKRYPKGTWLLKIETANDATGNEIWKMAREGKVTGFSYEAVEGLKVLEQ